MRGDPVIDFVAIDRGNKPSNNAGSFQPPPTISSTAMTAVLLCNDRPSLTTRKLAGSSASKPTAFNASAPSPDWTGTKRTRSLSRRAIHATEPLRRWHSSSSPLSAPARLQTPTRAPVHRYLQIRNMFVPFCPPVTPFVLQRALIRETSGHLNATVAPGGQLAPNTTDVANKQLRLGNVRNCHPIPALPHRRTPMKRSVFSVALSSLMVVAVCGTTQAAYYHHRLDQITDTKGA